MENVELNQEQWHLVLDALKNIFQVCMPCTKQPAVVLTAATVLTLLNVLATLDPATMAKFAQQLSVFVKEESLGHIQPVNTTLQ